MPPAPPSPSSPSFMIRTRPPPRSTLFPYTTLFRSVLVRIGVKLFRCHRLLGHLGELENVIDHLVLEEDRKSTRLNSSHPSISYAVFCLKKKNRASTTKAI